MNTRRALVFATALSLTPLLLPATPARAAVLFSNLDANNSSTASSTIIGGPGDFFDSRVATSFTTPNDLTPDLLGTAEVVVGDFNDFGPTTLDLRLYSDNAGLPGIPLDSLSASANLGEPNTPTTVLLTSTTHPLLLPNTTYWIGLTAGPNQRIFWLNNSLNQDLPAAVDWANTGTTWAATTDIDPAFRISSFVPEPTLALLLTPAAATLSLTRRRRHHHHH